MSKPFSFLRRALRRIGSRTYHPDRFLRGGGGVLHVGANVGQEADRYDALGLRVLWVEPIPEVFARLETNIAPYPNQRALQALLTDKHGVQCTFHVANNDGASSSLFDIHLHKDIWPAVRYDRSIQLQSTTLSALVGAHAIDLSVYPALVMDTQGSELLVLRGAESVLHKFAYIKTEVADFQAYAGCCELRDLSAFLSARGFREHSRKILAEHPAGGRYYNIIYRRAD
jgi:FkbM family methyltransferase